MNVVLYMYLSAVVRKLLKNCSDTEKDGGGQVPVPAWDCRWNLSLSLMSENKWTMAQVCVVFLWPTSSVCLGWDASVGPPQVFPYQQTVGQHTHNSKRHIQAHPYHTHAHTQGGWWYYYLHKLFLEESGKMVQTAQLCWLTYHWPIHNGWMVG